MTTTHIETARRYLALLETFAPPEAFDDILHPEVVQQELPNLLTPKGRARKLHDMKAGIKLGPTVLSNQSYTIVGEVVDGDRIALEFTWVGTTAIAVGPLPPGTTMRAHIAVFMTFQDGLIIKQRNYDCYEPFPIRASVGFGR